MTKIEWTNRTWNPNQGCTKISEGCKHCYAEKFHKRLKAMGIDKYQNDFGQLQLWLPALTEPKKWEKASMVFVNSMSDTFHRNITFKQINEVFNTMQHCARHTYQVLTKRPDRIIEFIDWKRKQLSKKLNIASKWVPKNNIWFGASVENQKEANNRIPLLLKTYSKIKFVSVEPMLSKIDLSIYMASGWTEPPYDDIINWVIVGCESGPGRRPCKTEWIESIVEQCQDAEVPVFIKQININGKVEKNIKKFPKHLQLQQFPIINSHNSNNSHNSRTKKQFA